MRRFGVALVTAVLLGCDAGMIDDREGDGAGDRSVAPLPRTYAVAGPEVVQTRGSVTKYAAETTWRLPSGAEVRILGVTKDDRTLEVSARLRIENDPHVLRMSGTSAGYDLRLESGSGDFFGIAHGRGALGDNVITEYTPTERMSISRDVFPDGLVREVYVHSTAGRRAWVHPSESRVSDAFLSEYPAWFPDVSTLTDENRLGVWLGEIAHSEVMDALASAICVASVSYTRVDLGEQAPANRPTSTQGAVGPARLPGWFGTFCAALGGAARGKCTFVGPANAGCYYLIGATVGCAVVEVFDAAGWL